jgi:hypothetical protein
VINSRRRELAEFALDCRFSLPDGYIEKTPRRSSERRYLCIISIT